MPTIQTRRQFLTTVSLAGASGFVSAPLALAAEGAFETTTVRILKNPGICIAPQYVAEELLVGEGFTDIRYVDQGPTLDLSVKIGRGDADFSLDFAARIVQTIDNGGAIMVLGGVHVGCYELFAKDEIRSISDLKGRTVGIQIGGTNPHAFLIAMAAHVGLDPRQDIHWIISTDPSVKPIELFAEGKIDAFLGTPPEPQQLRARGFVT
jgi:NitT/TauT family transport system substrate-binding protein